MIGFEKSTVPSIISSIILILSISTISVCHDSDHETYLSNGHYINKWAIRIYGGFNTANKIAQELGYKNLGPVSHFVKYIIS